jgi:putative flippase GtrA
MERLAAALRHAHDLATLQRFAGVGLVTTVLDIAMFAALTAAALPPALANVTSYSCGIALSYALNRRWTFGERASLAQALKFVVAMLSGLALSTLLLVILTSIMPPLAAKAATVPIVFLWNYHSSRQWVFRHTAA